MITGSNIVLTGASSGIGLEALKILAKGEGNKILAVARTAEEKLTGFSENVTPLSIDVGSKEAVDAIFEKANELFGGEQNDVGDNTPDRCRSSCEERS